MPDERERWNKRQPRRLEGAEERWKTSNRREMTEEREG